jgi:glycerophosphoryl diester phosphodiesterase
MTRKKAVVIIPALAVISFLGYIYVHYILIPSFNAKLGEAAGMPHPAVIAHRGASYLAPEETEPAYLLARDMGADYLEMDVQRTKDHVLIAFHDDTPERTTNVATVFPGREKDPVETFTLNELKQLDAGSWFNSKHPSRARTKYAGVKILALEEIMTIAESGEKRPSLYIETKSPERHPGYEQELVDLLRKKGWLGKFPDTGISKVVFQSFEKSSLRHLKALAPEAPRIYLLDREMAARSGWDALIREAVEVASGIGPTGYLGWPWNIGKAHRAGLVVHIYTVNDNWQYRVFSFFGADGFFTDRCDRLLRYYGRKPSAKPEGIEGILAKYGY